MPATSARQPATVVRPAREADADTIAQLSATLGYPATAVEVRDRLQSMLGSQTDLIAVATKSTGAVIGWMQAHASHVLESGFRVEIIGLVVAPEARRHGAGRALVNHAEEWAHKLGAKAIVVRSNVQRVESHAFYPALGYETSKTQTVYRKTWL
jgi:predicted N-acetyltransferase YhbS